MPSLTTENHPSPTSRRSRLIARLGQNPPADRISTRDSEAPTPLSYSQEQLWIMSQLEPDNPIYNVAGALRFDGPLQADALERALTEVVRRHEILRSRFVTMDAGPRQRVLPNADLPWERLDLSVVPEKQKTPAFERHAEVFVRRPFRLHEEAPLRALLATLAPQQHILLLTLHHMVSDRWSVGVLMREVGALYAAFHDGLPSPLPALPLQYADYCVWQRGRQAQWRDQLTYWRQKLAGVPPLLELPTDRPRPPLQNYRGDAHGFELGADLTRKLKQLAQRHHATLFMVMAAAFSTLLHRYSGSDDFCIGYPVAGRNRTQTANLIGFFVNTLVLRCRVDGETPFIDWLAQLREQALQDQAHQELAFGQLLETLNPPRNASHAPVFQVMLTMQNAPASGLKLPGIETTAMPINTRMAQYDLALLLEESAGKIQGLFEYSTDLFESATVARMAGHLQTLLGAIVREPTTSLGRLPILSDTERRRLLVEWSGKDVASTEQRFVHQLFAEQAAQQPDKPALVCAGQVMSYRELNTQAGHWSLVLKRHGIGPESKIGVSLERSAELIVALLAVLKSGAAYIPLDPDYPDDRLAFMLADARMDVLITHSDLAGKFRGAGIETVLIDQAPPATARLETVAIRSDGDAPNADNTAYIIYTSGSSGHPKGVAVSHRNLLHSTLARSRYYQEPLRGFLLLSSFAFDSSVAGIFWTLTQGGCLCLPRRNELTDPQALAGLIKRHGISHLLALPSFYAAIIAAAGPAELASLQTVIVAGEACAGEVASAHHRLLPAVPLYNEYGPTEGTVWSSVHRCAPEYGMPVLPIGRPIDNARLYILDSRLQLVPVGVPGELCIAGAGLAQGYLNRPELTAEKFIPHPYAATGERLYRSGDLARFRGDGEIEFLGRIDHQVKIRGYRVELGEIEERLLRHSAVREAVVLAKEDSPGGTKLVAYLVAQSSDQMPEAAFLQAHLKQTLPDYMVPARYVWLETLPLTPNGKCDRRALAALQAPDRSPEAIRLPDNWIEEALAAIWKEVLNLETVGVDRNFFDLGGHSLAAIQVNSRIRHLLNVDVPLEVLFEAATIESLASAVIELLERQHGKEVFEDLLSEIAE